MDDNKSLLQWFWDLGYHAGDTGGQLGDIPQMPDVETPTILNDVMDKGAEVGKSMATSLIVVGGIGLAFYLKPWK